MYRNDKAIALIIASEWCMNDIVLGIYFPTNKSSDTFPVALSSWRSITVWTCYVTVIIMDMEEVTDVSQYDGKY
jgi:hypothetical protein